MYRSLVCAFSSSRPCSHKILEVIRSGSVDQSTGVRHRFPPFKDCSNRHLASYFLMNTKVTGRSLPAAIFESEPKPRGRNGRRKDQFGVSK